MRVLEAAAPTLDEPRSGAHGGADESAHAHSERLRDRRIFAAELRLLSWPSMRHSLASFALLLLVLSCGGKSPARTVEPARTGRLALESETRAPLAKPGPLTITYFGPVGEVEGRAEVSVVFDRAMVALATQEPPPREALRITPPVEGSLRWLGAQTLLFEPRGPLPMATEFEVALSSELKALDGQLLAQPLTFRFATPALALVRSTPHAGAEGAERTQPIDLYFNQAIAPERVLAAAELRVGSSKGEKSVEFSVERAEKSDLRRLRVRAKKPFPLGAKVSLQLRTGLHGEEGARPLARDHELSFQVYGPLRLLANAPCAGEDCVPKITLSNPVSQKALLAALRFDPPLAKPLQIDGDYQSSEFYFYSELAPSSSYRVSIEGELFDVHGNALEGARSVLVKTPPLAPRAELLLEGELFVADAKATPKLAVRLANVKGARLELTRLRADELASAKLETLAPAQPPKVLELGSTGPVEKRVAEVELAPLLSNGKGVLLATLTAHTRGEPLIDRRLLAFSDLGATLKSADTGGLVWVTRLVDAQPVPGAKVRVSRGESVLASGSADAHGLFKFALPPAAEDQRYEELTAVVEHQGDLSFSRKSLGLGPWELASHASDEQTTGTSAAHLFTDRGIYRPGDTVQLKGILRSQSEQGLLPTRGEVELSVEDAEARVIERARATLSAYGTFDYSLRIPGSIELGTLLFRVRRGREQFDTSVEVAEYKPVELEVDTRVQKARALRGERVKAQVSGRYLFGAPARDARVFWSARYEPLWFSSEAYPGYAFGDAWSDDQGADAGAFALAGSGEQQLDQSGTTALDISLARAPLGGPAQLTIDATVLASGAEVSSATRLETRPAGVLLGLKPGRSVSESEQPLELSLLALDLQDQPAARVALEAKLERRVYTSELVDGERRTRVSDALVGAPCRVHSQREPVQCSFTPKEPGLHVASVRARDAAGRETYTRVPIYVYGAGQASWQHEQGDPRVLTLKSEQRTYPLGELARILVPSPFRAAEALVTVEREDVLSVERVKIGQAGTVDVRIDQRFVPNAFVSVVLLRPLASEPESGPPYRVGTLELSADVSARRLAVEVKPDAREKRPGEALQVKLAVHDREGKPVQSELTVYAVDEGVLALTRYRTPDPFAAIYAPRGLSVWTSEGRANLGTLYGRDGPEKGGDEGGGGGEGEVLRSRFAPLAFYAPRVESDAAGQAEVRFTLPDATTRYRIMAVAASRGSELGAGAGEVVTKKPLFMRPLLPRVLRAGDLVEAGVAVHNERPEAVEVELSLAAEGVRIEGSARTRRRVEPGKVEELRFAVRAESVGEARFQFSLSAGDERDGLSLTRRVLSPSVLETVSAHGEADVDVREQLAPLTGVRRDVGGLELALSTSALAQLEAPARALLAYEYGCSEQLSSRLIAAAALESLRVPLALAEPSFAGVAQKIASELERHQGRTGAFGMWRADDGSSPEFAATLSAYALLALDQLKRAQIPVSRHASDSAKRFLTSYLRREQPAADRKLELHTRAFVLFALARAGTLDAAYANTLFAARAELAPSARVELAHALAHDPQNRGRVDTLVSELGGHVRMHGDQAHLESNVGDGHAPAFASDVRATAELVLLLLAHAPEHPLLPKLARWLAAARARSGSWDSTHESAWALLALAGYHADKERVRPELSVAARLGSRLLGQAELRGHEQKASFRSSMRELPAAGGELAIERRGQGALHYLARLSYARSELPTEPVERGFFVQRSYERIERAAFAAGDVRGSATEAVALGDYVRVTLRVVAPSARRFVLLSDPIPAGLEPVNAALATESQSSARALRDTSHYDHHELRDDRALFAIDALPAGVYSYSYLTRATSSGSFVAPSARVEEMYEPETEALTPASRFEVRAP